MSSGSTHTTAIEKLLRSENLSEVDVFNAMVQLETDPDPADIAAFLMLLKQKGETHEEIKGMVDFLKTKMIAIRSPGPALDIVGTGGDGANTVNISTGSAILAAACGLLVAKHGNRSVSSRCGAADVIEACGIPLTDSAKAIEHSLLDVGIAFMFAPHFNPALKKFQAVRKRLGVRTIFNLLGPLLNPASAHYLLLGTWDNSLVDKMANALRLDTNIQRAIVFHGCGIDELSTLGPSNAILIDNGNIQSIAIDPEKLGFRKSTLKELEGGDAGLNKQLLVEALTGKKSAISDTLILNAGVALWLCGQATDIKEGVEAASRALMEGKGINKLNEWATHAKRHS